ncbi:MAG: M23 family metallopeptidase, partial [Lawsonibacter sp.]|nr:M23 family metallopeptidase [Lawsonibacter sp.]
ENYTMNQLSLGDLETTTPVLGHINSIYGYRKHPLTGEYQFHGGVDIGGQTGDPIKAFAAGTVEYVGKDDSYGLYLQLDHGNGVKSFYAHCSAVCVTKGQSVALGEKIAEIGSSGAATGPHLHLELKFDQTHLNPVYYIQYLSDQ